MVSFLQLVIGLGAALLGCVAFARLHRGDVRRGLFALVVAASLAGLFLGSLR